MQAVGLALIRRQRPRSARLRHLSQHIPACICVALVTAQPPRWLHSWMGQRRLHDMREASGGWRAGRRTARFPC
jgi:hypothetical protein